MNAPSNGSRKCVLADVLRALRSKTDGGLKRPQFYDEKSAG
jgi:hypothetical protein